LATFTSLSIAYFSKALTKKWQDAGKTDVGDRGGNEIMVVPADGKVAKLHFYWDEHQRLDEWRTVLSETEDLRHIRPPRAG